MTGFARSLPRAFAALAFLLSAAAQAAAQTASDSAGSPPGDAAIRALLADRMARNGVGMVAGVVDADGARIVGYGRAGRGDGAPPASDTVFLIGSVTKTFTALLLADMALKGEVGLDDPVQDYLPDGVTLRVKGRPMTLRDLATHMSGLPPMPTNMRLDGEPDPYEAYVPEALYAFLAAFEPARAPGEKAEYSNLGVSLLGIVLTRAAGEEYETLLKARILDPLGMKDTAIRLSPEQEARLAPGHDRYLHPVRTWEMKTLYASGSLRSTADDLVKFVAGYLGAAPPSLAAAMAFQLDPPAAEGEPARPLGWGVREDGVVRHSGGKQGYRSAVAFDPETGVGAVVLANARTYDQPMDIALHLVTGEALAPAPDAPAPKKRLALGAAFLERYAGRYRFASGETVEIAAKDGRLLYHVPGNGVSEFFPAGENDFFLDTGNDELSFERDASGRATALLLYGDGREAGGPERAPRATE